MPDAIKSDVLASLEDALEAFLSHVKPVDRVAKIELDYADNRILARDIIAPQDYPHYDRSYMDGYAVCSRDTAGSSPDTGVLLRVVSSDRMRDGQCMQVHTGSELPEGADAVVKVEDTVAEDGGIRIFCESKPGDNFTPKGQAIHKGDLVFPAGLQLKPTNIALLATLGMNSVEVYEKPRVLVIPTGDELLERGRHAGPGQINESNGLMCQLLVRRYGGKPAVWDIVPDVREKLKAAIEAGLSYDLIVTTGGTSVGVRDLMPELVASMGKVVVHGVGMKPGRPVGMGYIEDAGKRTPIIFLPGFPDACAVSAMFFVDRAVRKMGRYPPSRYPACTARLSAGFPPLNRSRSIARVLVRDGRATQVSTVGPTPVEGEYGYVIVPEDARSYVAGAPVDVLFLE